MSRIVPTNVVEAMLELQPGVIIAQKYRLERLLKRGGMGAVWIGTHLGLETTVAIKFMSNQMLDLPTDFEDEDGTRSNPRALTRARFEREAKAAARIRSTNVVQILDHGIDQGTPYIVMEYLRGEDLEMRLKRVKRMAMHDLLPIVNAIGRALHLAHAEELVHRDLKPDNVFLAQEGDEEIPKILDFGVAKAKTGPSEQNVDGSTAQGSMVGTPHYMSPEQIQVGGQVDHRTDLWAFGVLIFRALTGRLPFPSTRLLELAMQICRDPIPKATEVAPDLPANVDAFLGKALSRDAAQRFQSAREMVAAFQEITAGSAMPAAPAEKRAASDKRPMKNRALLFVLAGAGFVFVAGGGLFAWLAGAPEVHDVNADASPPVASATVSGVATPVETSTAPAPSASVPETLPAPTSTTNTPPIAPRSTATATTTAVGTAKTKKRNVGY